MGEHDRKVFLDEMAVEPHKKMDNMLGMVRAENSQCYKERDEECIDRVITNTVGYHKINAMVLEQVRKWVICVALKELGDAKGEKEKLVLQNTVGELYNQQGKYEEAESHLKPCFVGREALLGEHHPDTMLSAHNLGTLYASKGEYDKAMRILLQ